MLWKVKNLSLLLTILVLLFYLDLGRYFLKYNPFFDQQLVFPSTPVMNFLQSQPGVFRIARVDPEVFPANTWTQYKLESIEGYDPMVSESYARFINVVNQRHFNDGINRYIDIKSYNPKFLDALNVKYLVGLKRDAQGVPSQKPFQPETGKSYLQFAFEDKATIVWQNPAVKERVFAVNKVFTYPKKEDAIKKLEDLAFNPTTEAILATEEKIPPLSLDVQNKIEDYSGSRLSVRVNSSGPAFLVVSIPYFQGWQLKEDGKSLPLWEVDGSLMGFLASPGNHLYELKYQPKSFTLGLQISLASLVLILGTSLYALKKKWW